MDNGWIKLHRKLLDNPIMLNAELLQLFLYCLLRANHNDKEIIWNGKLKLIPRGSFISGLLVMCKDLKQKQTSIYRRLKVLTELNYISVNSENKFSVITVINYSSYQITKNESGKQTENKEKTNGKQVETNNNDKNDNNDKNKDIADFPNLNNELFIKAFNEWLDFRKELRKPLKPSTIKKQLEFLNKQPDPVNCINQSIQNGWQGLFEVKNGYTGTFSKNGGNPNTNGLPPIVGKKYKTAILPPAN